MNPVSQSDMHPGAEILSAFAEQALAERERALVLAHLAACGRCRQVVYLAQEEAEPETAAAEAPALRRGPQIASWRRKSGLWSWRIAWVPAAALAGVVALALLVHVRRGERSMEMARLAPQPTPQAEGIASKPSPPERTQAALPPVAPASAGAGERRRKTAPPGAESEPPPQEALASAAFSSRPQAYAQSKAMVPSAVPSAASREEAALPASASAQVPPAPLPALGSAYPFHSAQLEPEPARPEAAAAASLRERLAGASSSPPASANQAQARTLGAVFDGQPSPTMPLTASAQPPGAEPAPLDALENAGQRRMAGMATARIAKIAPLPGGQTAVSTATAGHRILAIGPAGTLFLSQDSGSTWERVARQWTGRVVAVGVRPALSGSAAPAPPGASAAKESGAGAPSAAATVFEIVNDKGRIWSSTDGETWTAQ